MDVSESVEENAGTAPVQAEQKPPGLLIVEDNDDGRELLSQGIAGCGYTVGAVKTGKEGILRSLESPPDIVLLNLHLSGLDGLRTIKLMKTLEPIRRGLLFVLLDEAAKDDILRAVQAGADACISKDVSVHAIHMKIQQVIKQKRPPPAPLFEHIHYSCSASGGTLTIHLEEEVNGEVGKDLVQLVRALIPLHPLRLVLSFEKVRSIATSAIGYLSDAKDTAQDCGGTFFLSNFSAEKYASNVQRVIKTNFQIQ